MNYADKYRKPFQKSHLAECLEEGISKQHLLKLFGPVYLREHGVDICIEPVIGSSHA